MLSSFLDIYLWVELQSYKVTILNLSKNYQTVFESSCIFFIPISSTWAFPHLHLHLLFSLFFIYYNHLSRWKVVSHCGLTCFSLIVFFYIFFGEMFNFFAHIFIGLFVLLVNFKYSCQSGCLLFFLVV